MKPSERLTVASGGEYIERGNLRMEPDTRHEVTGIILDELDARLQAIEDKHIEK